MIRAGLRRTALPPARQGDLSGLRSRLSAWNLPTQQEPGDGRRLELRLPRYLFSPRAGRRTPGRGGVSPVTPVAALTVISLEGGPR